MSWLIGVAGLCGAGKTTATEHFERAWGFRRVYLGQIVLDEVRSRGLPHTADSEREVQSALRAEFGAARLATEAAETVKQYLIAGESVIIDAIFRAEEYELFCSLLPDMATAVLSIHAPYQTRCSRLAARPKRPLTAEEVRSRDQNEVVNIGSGRVIALADIHVVNDGTEAEFRARLDYLWSLRSTWAIRLGDSRIERE